MLLANIINPHVCVQVFYVPKEMRKYSHSWCIMKEYDICEEISKEVRVRIDVEAWRPDFALRVKISGTDEEMIEAYRMVLKRLTHAEYYGH